MLLQLIIKGVRMEVRLRRVSQYLYHVESYSEKWGWIDLTDPGHPVPYVEARRMQLEAQGRPTRLKEAKK